MWREGGVDDWAGGGPHMGILSSLVSQGSFWGDGVMASGNVMHTCFEPNSLSHKCKDDTQIRQNDETMHPVAKTICAWCNVLMGTKWATSGKELGEPHYDGGVLLTFYFGIPHEHIGMMP